MVNSPEGHWSALPTLISNRGRKAKTLLQYHKVALSEDEQTVRRDRKKLQQHQTLEERPPYE
jgi:hypothetical protein